MALNGFEAALAMRREAARKGNPVVKTTPLNAYPGWVVREYANGQFDACQLHGLAVTGGCDSFSTAVACVRGSRGAL